MGQPGKPDGVLHDFFLFTGSARRLSSEVGEAKSSDIDAIATETPSFGKRRPQVASFRSSRLVPQSVDLNRKQHLRPVGIDRYFIDREHLHFDIAFVVKSFVGNSACSPPGRLTSHSITTSILPGNGIIHLIRFEK